MGYPVRPSGYVGWGSTGMTNVAEPLDAKKAYGWAIGEKPASSYFNWLAQKQDEWTQYLAWRAELNPVVADDFIYRPTGTWSMFAPSGSLFAWTYIDGAPMIGSVVGGPAGLANGTGYAEMVAKIGFVHGRDFRIDHVVKIDERSPSGALEFGFMYQHSGMSGSNPQMTWIATGRLGTLAVAWKPSGASPTRYDVGVMPTSASGWHKYTIESRGPTMAFFIDDVLKGAAPAVMFGDDTMYFGHRIGGQSSAALMYVDYASLKVRRGPT